MHRLSQSRFSGLLAEAGTPEPLRRWFDAGRSRLASWGFAPASGLPTDRAAAKARTTFLAGVADIPGPRSIELQRRIRAAAGLRDLWHLRSDIFALVSHALDQSSAQSRLATLNKHFPTRSPRSGFAPLEPTSRP
ncbi:MAG: hypothetical protein ABIO45_13765 [Burkholderiaceae bacterium]